MLSVNTALRPHRSVSLEDLMKEAVGPKNFDNINDIFTTNDQFVSMVVDVVPLGVPFLIPFNDGETGYQIRKRLSRSGYNFGNTVDSAKYMIRNLAGIKRFEAVLAISQDSLLKIPENGCNYASYAHAANNRAGHRSFSFYNLGNQFTSKHAVLVFGPAVGEQTSPGDE